MAKVFIDVSLSYDTASDLFDVLHQYQSDASSAGDWTAELGHLYESLWHALCEYAEGEAMRPRRPVAGA